MKAKADNQSFNENVAEFHEECTYYKTRLEQIKFNVNCEISPFVKQRFTDFILRAYYQEYNLGYNFELEYIKKLYLDQNININAKMTIKELYPESITIAAINYD